MDSELNVILFADSGPADGERSANCHRTLAKPCNNGWCGGSCEEFDQPARGLRCFPNGYERSYLPFFVSVTARTGIIIGINPYYLYYRFVGDTSMAGIGVEGHFVGGERGFSPPTFPKILVPFFSTRISLNSRMPSGYLLCVCAFF